MEGAESTIVYTPEEQTDAEETKKLVEEKGGKVHLIQADLRSQQACKNVAEKAKEKMGRINILVLNHGTQMMRESIADLSEYVYGFLINVSKSRRKLIGGQRTMAHHFRYEYSSLLLPL